MEIKIEYVCRDGEKRVCNYSEGQGGQLQASCPATEGDEKSHCISGPGARR